VVEAADFTVVVSAAVDFTVGVDFTAAGFMVGDSAVVARLEAERALRRQDAALAARVPLPHRIAEHRHFALLAFVLQACPGEPGPERTRLTCRA